MLSYIPRPRSLIIQRRGLRKPERPILDPDDKINFGLLGCWLLGDVGTSGTTADISGNGNDGTLTSSPTLADSHHGGQSLKFDGSASFVSIPNTKRLDCGQTSVCAWVNFTALTNAYSAVFGRVIGSSFIQIMVKSTGKLACFVHVPIGTVSYDGTGTHTLSTGTWYFIGFSYSTAASSGLVGFVNAATDHSPVSGAGQLINSINQITVIGKDTNTSGRVVNGKIDGVRQWNRALTQSEWTRLYAEPYAGIISARPRSRAGIPPLPIPDDDVIATMMF